MEDATAGGLAHGETTPRVFFSVGDHSGDLHGANLIECLRQRLPGLRCSGFGGERMAQAGCALLYPLCDLAVVGLGQVVRHLRQFVHLVGEADRSFATNRPDAVVLIDYPGFNWWIARRAHARGIPVIYFVPPQLWAWGPWRIRKMRRDVDHVLCTLPFEQQWYEQKGVRAHYVGHPYFDELRLQQFDHSFIRDQQTRSGPVIALLPGSRTQELAYNVSSLLATMRMIHQQRPDTRFLFACLKPHQAETVRSALTREAASNPVPLPPCEVYSGRTPEIIHLAHSCVAVSGSVSLELLYRRRPTVILYRISFPSMILYRLLKTCRYITLVNLLANRVLFPEHVTVDCPAEDISKQIVNWLNDRQAYQEVCDQLTELRERVAIPGACERAADEVVKVLRGMGKPRRAQVA